MADRTRVLVSTGDTGVPLLGPSGASEHFRQVALALAGRGFAIRVATPHRTDLRGSITSFDLPSKHLSEDPAATDVARARQAARFLDHQVRCQRPAWVWERHGLRTPAACDRRLPRLLEVNAPLNLEREKTFGKRPSTRLRRWERQTLQSASAIVAVSSWLAEWLVDEMQCDPARVHVVHNGTRSVPMRRNVADSSKVAPTIGFVGSCGRWQGAPFVSELLDALGPPWRGLCVGDGPFPPPPHPRLRHIGTVPPAAVAAHVAQMHVGLAPYRRDGPRWYNPLKVLEYQAQGVPVVASAGVGHGLLGPNDQTVAHYDIGGWCAAIRRALHRPREVSHRSWSQVVDEALRVTGFDQFRMTTNV